MTIQGHPSQWLTLITEFATLLPDEPLECYLLSENDPYLQDCKEQWIIRADSNRSWVKCRDRSDDILKNLCKSFGMRVPTYTRMQQDVPDGAHEYLTPRENYNVSLHTFVSMKLAKVDPRNHALVWPVTNNVHYTFPKAPEAAGPMSSLFN